MPPARTWGEYAATARLVRKLTEPHDPRCPHICNHGPRVPRAPLSLRFSGFDGFAVACFSFDVFSGDLPIAAVDVALHGLALRFQPQPATALLICGDSEVGNEFPFCHRATCGLQIDLPHVTSICAQHKVAVTGTGER